MHLKNITKKATIFSMVAMIGAVGVLSVGASTEIKAAGKTVEAFENNSYGSKAMSFT